MNRKMLLSAVAAAAFASVTANAQMAKEKPPAATVEHETKYEVFVGYGYTSLNQVNQSNSGLQGISASITRDWGRFFGVTVEGGHYQWAVTRANTGNPTVDQYLAGPVVHAPLYEKASIFVHGLLGAEHTGGISIRPNQSFAGGAGMGIDYKLGPHLGLRAYGDDIASSFTLSPFQPGYSPHMRWNAHASIGVTYKF